MPMCSDIGLLEIDPPTGTDSPNAAITAL